MAEEKQLDCPSAPHQHPEARLLGVVLEEEGAPRVSYVEKGVDLPEDFDAEQLDVDPGHAIRFAAPCANKGCGQWKEGGCGLGREIIKRLQPAVDVAPACTLRATCRWIAENGTASCKRCPQDRDAPQEERRGLAACPRNTLACRPPDRRERVHA